MGDILPPIRWKNMQGSFLMLNKIWTRCELLWSEWKQHWCKWHRICIPKSCDKQSHKGAIQLDMRSEGPHMQMVKLTVDPSVSHRALHPQVRRGMRQLVGSVHSPHKGRVKARGCKDAADGWIPKGCKDTKKGWKPEGYRDSVDGCWPEAEIAHSQLQDSTRTRRHTDNTRTGDD